METQLGISYDPVAREFSLREREEVGGRKEGTNSSRDSDGSVPSDLEVCACMCTMSLLFKGCNPASFA